MQIPETAAKEQPQDKLPAGVQRVAAFLQAQGHPHAPRMLDHAARTAQQAADALGVALGQIAKSIIFKHKVVVNGAEPSDADVDVDVNTAGDAVAVLVVTSGDRRVDPLKVAARVGVLERADADFVKARTGFSIGGVAPIAHTHPCITLVDEDLLRFEQIWAAAGHPHSVFALSPQELCRMVGVQPCDVVERAP